VTQISPEPYLTKVDSRGRLVIRKALRESMELPNGGAVKWSMNEDGQVALRAAEKDEND
jgi:bifunctional DNA-binding transcriptional regulator/antitoxin component of YhaV-PrlF toxin-antitoxin module